MDTQSILLGAATLFCLGVVILNVIDRWGWVFNGRKTRRMWRKAGFWADRNGKLYVTPQYNQGAKEKSKQKV